jgi:hypothetical protein
MVPQMGNEAGADRPTREAYYRGTSSEKAEPMARTFRRRSMLLPVTLAALLENGFGQRGFDFITYRPGTYLWQCPTCQRVEPFYQLGHRPRCSGTPENPHSPTKAVKVEPGEELHETDRRRLFK